MKLDLTNLLKIGDLFAAPAKLVHRVGKSIIGNGEDIFTKVSTAITAFNSKDYKAMGNEMGKAMAQVFLKDPVGKDFEDGEAFSFLHGYCTGVSVDHDAETIYNHIDGLEANAWQPVERAMKTYQELAGEMNTRMWTALHEVGHVFEDGAT